MSDTARACYVGSNPQMRGLGLTGLVRDHPDRPGLLLIQLDDIGRWERQMTEGLGHNGTGWVAYKRTSWKILPDLWSESGESEVVT